MSPANFVYNSSSMNIRYFEAPSYFFKRNVFFFVKASYFYNLIFIKFNRWMFRAFKVRTSSLFRFIAHIICMRAYKQMIRINTSLIVALMTHMLCVFNFPKMKLPGKPVGTYHNLVNFYSAISSRIFTSNPFPTSMKWNKGHFSPESIFKFSGVHYE